MKKAFKFLIVFLLLATAWHYFQTFYNTHKAFSYLNSKFEFVPYTNSYRIASSRFSFAQPKIPRALLLIHGYSSGPSDFGPLFSKLEEAKITYSAPLLTGFGIGDFHLLSVVQPSDWVRDTIFAYDALATIAEKVDVLGFSNGACLALILAEHRPINKLILISPNLVKSKDDRLYGQMLETPVLKQLFWFFYPVPSKPIRGGRLVNTDIVDPEAALKAFQYRAIPVESAVALWKLQDEADVFKPFPKETFALFGEKDLIMNKPEAEAFLKQSGNPITFINYPNSAHNLFLDYQKEEAADAVIKILTAP